MEPRTPPLQAPGSAGAWCVSVILAATGAHAAVACAGNWVLLPLAEAVPRWRSSRLSRACWAEFCSRRLGGGRSSECAVTASSACRNKHSESGSARSRALPDPPQDRGWGPRSVHRPLCSSMCPRPRGHSHGSGERHPRGARVVASPPRGALLVRRAVAVLVRNRCT